MNTTEKREKKSSLILALSFSAERKRTSPICRPIRANGVIKEIVTSSSDHVPYRLVPRLFVSMGRRMMPSRRPIICAAKTKAICQLNLAYSFFGLSHSFILQFCH
jgi:hypothetical protein